MSRLTEKQRKWAEALAGEAEGNQTEAARIAGYSGDENALSSRGAENARNRKIRAYLRDLMEEDPLVASREERQRFWTALMRGELEMEETITVFGKQLTMSRTPNPDERMKAAEMLGKTQGDFGAKGTSDDPHRHDITINVVNAPRSGDA